MAMFRVIYQSMTAFYGPKLIEAEDEYEAKKKFANGAFRPSEYQLIHVSPVSKSEIANYLRRNSTDD